MSGERRSRRAKSKVVSYAQEQEVSDDDIFEDSPVEEPTPKRGRPRGSGGNSSRKPRRKNNSASNAYDDDDFDYGDDGHSSKPVYTEKGYDPTLPPIRERFPFTPEYELDGSPRIDVIVGRRPIDEKESNEKGSDEENQEPEDSDDDSDAGIKANHFLP